MKKLTKKSINQKILQQFMPDMAPTLPNLLSFLGNKKITPTALPEMPREPTGQTFPFISRRQR